MHTPATRITFISHAATAAVRRAAFPLDEGLEESACEAIAGLGWVAPRAQRIFAGPELRTRQTADALGLKYVVEPELRDCDYGRWRGLAMDEVEPESLMAWLTDAEAAPHGGESVAAVMERTRLWLEAQQGAGHGVAVTHPAVIRAAVVCAMGAPVEAFWRVDVAPLSLTDLRWNGRVWTVRAVGCSLQRGGSF